MNMFRINDDVDIKFPYVFIMSLVAVTLLFGSCAGGGPDPASVSKPGTDNVTELSEPEASEITIPVPDKAKLPVITFSVSPASISPGATAVLAWNVTNASSVSIDHAIGAVPLSGTRNVSPTAPTTYKLVAVNDSGSAVKTVSLIVSQSSSPPKTTGK